MSGLGIIADVHGNAPALDAVLARLAREGVTEILCLGDLVGYNAGSDRVVDALRRAGARCIAGNHDLIAMGRLGFDRCARRPAHALARTRETLGRDARAFLSQLPSELSLDEGRVLAVHGDLGDPQRYLRTDADLVESAPRIRAHAPAARICLHGHTHEARVASVREGRVVRRPVEAAVMPLEIERGELVFLNPGSVDGQRKPIEERDAELAILETGDAPKVRFLRVPYDHTAVERESEREGYRPGRISEAFDASRRALAGARRIAQRLL